MSYDKRFALIDSEGQPLSVVRTFGTTRGVDQRSVGLVLD